MTCAEWEIVGLNDRELPIRKTVGDALRDLIRKRYPNNTAKRIERDWDLDPKTAKNVVTQGHVSERTLTKAVRAEGWGLLEALGAELTGETYHQYEERKLQQIIQEAEDARQNLVRLRTRREALDAFARDDDDVEPRQAVEPMRARAGDGGGRARQSSDSRSGAE